MNRHDGRAVGSPSCGAPGQPITGVDMHWFFDGLGTFLIGLVLGGGAGWRLAIRSVKQRQSAGASAVQTQVGGDQIRKNR